jgi:hypothetical protein
LHQIERVSAFAQDFALRPTFTTMLQKGLDFLKIFAFRDDRAKRLRRRQRLTVTRP